MKSIVLYTEEIDDPSAAAEELFGQAEDFEFEKNSIGIIFADEELEYEEFYECLARKWRFPIIGATALVSLAGTLGCKESGISMMILTADDCAFATGISTGITAENYREKIKETYGRLAEQLPEEEKLILSYSTNITGMVVDSLIDAMEAAGTKAPIYGALASDHWSFSDYRVFYNGMAQENAHVLVLISGNITPKFVFVQSVSDMANVSYEVTESKENQVFRLGNNTLLDALNQANLGSSKNRLAADYALTPFVVTLKKKDTLLNVSRSLARLNQETGSGVFQGGIPEGSSLKIGVISKEVVQSSVAQAFRGILTCLSKEHGGSAAILCTSCASRILALGGDSTAEADCYKELLPKDTSLLGLYSYGEICPMAIENMEYVNLFHNCTFTILAF